MGEGRRQATLRVATFAIVALGASAAGAAGVEEVVDLDTLDEPAFQAKKPQPPGEHTHLPESALPQVGKVVEEVVDLDTLDEAAVVGVPEYDRHPWLGLLPLLPLLVLMWNVDWREGRVKGEIASARARMAPKKKAVVAPVKPS